MLAKVILPNAIIHAFEPLSIHFSEFRTRTSHIPDITLHQVASSVREDNLNTQVASFSDASSLLEIVPATYGAFGITKEREEPV